jgi:hypothetical protein
MGPKHKLAIFPKTVLVILINFHEPMDTIALNKATRVILLRP